MTHSFECLTQFRIQTNEHQPWPEIACMFDGCDWGLVVDGMSLEKAAELASDHVHEAHIVPVEQ